VAPNDVVALMMKIAFGLEAPDGPSAEDELIGDVTGVIDGIDGIDAIVGKEIDASEKV
jgi:hypothetical protein